MHRNSIGELFGLFRQIYNRRGSSLLNHHFKEVEMKNTWKSLLVAIAMVLAVSLTVNPVMAATNQATDPGGGATTLGVSNIVTITSLALSLVKEARLLDGTLLGASTSMAAGTKFYFVIYVDNTTGAPLSDVRIVDLVATGATNFTVDNTTFEVLNNAGLGIDMNVANDTAWAGTAAWLGLTWDAQTVGAGDDYLDWAVTTPLTVTIGQAANVQLDVPVSGEADPVADPRRVAFRFQATINP